MSLLVQLFKNTVVLTGGQFASQALSFGRNVIIARLLNPEDMGIAATFAITITLLEMISNLSVDIILVQAKDGDDPTFQGTAHLYQVVRGVSVGLVILAGAPIITWLFKIPETVWAFRLLALVPVFRGLMHLDWNRLQRKMQYRTAILVEMVPQAVVTLAAFPMLKWRGDYSTVLWLVLMQAAIGLLVSHFFSQRSYQLNWNREYASRLLVFGWPLLVNGFLMFGAMQGDRLIIGTFYTMTELGVYSVAFSLTLTLAFIIGKIGTSLFLPLLSRIQYQKTEFRELHFVGVQVLALIGGIVAIPFITAGGDIIVFFFGNQYFAVHGYASWLGVLLVARLFRLAPTISSLACGDTKNSMYANFSRFGGVIAAICAAWQGRSLSVILICGIGGEILALLAATFRLQKLRNIKMIDSIYPPMVVSGVLFVAGVINCFSVFGVTLYSNYINCIFSYTILLVVSFFTFPIVRIFKKDFSLLNYKPVNREIC